MFDLLPTVFVGLGDDQEFKTALAAFTSLEDMTWLGDGAEIPEGHQGLFKLLGMTRLGKDA